MKNSGKIEPFCSFSPNSRCIIASMEYNAIIWEADTGQRLLELHDNNFMSYCCFSPSGKFIASSSWGGTVKVWNMGELCELFKG